MDTHPESLNIFSFHLELNNIYTANYQLRTLWYIGTINANKLCDHGY